MLPPSILLARSSLGIVCFLFYLLAGPYTQGIQIWKNSTMRVYDAGDTSCPSGLVGLQIPCCSHGPRHQPGGHERVLATQKRTNGSGERERGREIRDASVPAERTFCHPSRKITKLRPKENNSELRSCQKNAMDCGLDWVMGTLGRVGIICPVAA